MILVIGGAGYIGSHMCHLLRASGEPFVVMDNLSSGHEAAIQGAALIKGDLRSREDLDSVFRGHEIELVMHFAAHISVGESVREPAKYFDNNLAGVLTLLDVMRDHQVNRFVFSSTAAIFGEPHYVPIDEDHPKAPTSPYGLSKLMVEQVLADYDRAYGLKSVCLRYFNAAGADPESRIGEDHTPEEHLIPVAIQAALGVRPPLKIFGTDYETPDGTCMRDYVHVLDLASAHQLAVLHLRSGKDSRAYNLGNGHGFSVLEVIETVERVTGHSVPREDAARRPGDPARLVASSERIRHELGWHPEYSSLEAIIQTAWDWHRQNPEGFAS
jgi:UDP-glucose 4-epimerase